MTATSNRVSLAYATETTWGTIPVAGSKYLRFTSESLRHDQPGIVSAEIVNDRQLADFIRTQLSSSGEIAGELSYGLWDDFLEGAFMGTWATNVLTQGVTPKSFLLEKQFGDAAAAAFVSSLGNRINTFNFEARIGAIMQMRFGFLGKKLVPAGVTVMPGAVAAAIANPVMATVDNLTAITEGGSGITGCTEFTMSITNNLRTLFQLGNIDPLDINAGQLIATGSLVAYFATLPIYQKFTNLTQSALTVAIGTTTLKKYLLTLPAVKYTTAELMTPGQNQDIFVRLNYQAFKDTGVSNNTVSLTRAIV